MNTFKNLWYEYREFIRFFGLAFLFLVGWVLVMTFFPVFVQDLHYYTIRPQAEISAFLLELLGYDVQEVYGMRPCHALVRINQTAGACIGTGCSGLELFLLFAGFILLFRGNLKDKLWFIPLGLLAIFLLNIFRVVGLILIDYYHPEALQFNHKYTFVIVVYGALFGLWILWVRRFSNRQQTS